MASPLDNVNAVPPASALVNRNAEQVAFGLPVQAHQHADKQLPSPDHVPVYPLPACRAMREKIFAQACNEGDVAKVQRLLKAAPSLIDCPNCGALLHDAVVKGNREIVYLLLEFKKSNPVGYTIFLEHAAKTATSQGDIAMVRGLLKKDAAIRDDIDSLLIKAVMFEHLKLVEFLLQEGANIDADDGLMTPLIYALRDDDDLCMRYLLEQGADPNRRPANTRMPALAFACYHRELSKAKILLEAGALIDRGAYEGPTPLALAVEQGYEEIVRTLLQSGADVNAACEPSQAPLYQAVAKDRPGLATILLKAGAAPDLLCEQEAQMTPLMLAVQREDYFFAELLVKHGADMHKPGAEGFSALELAVRAGSEDIVAMLREKAACQASKPDARPQLARQ